MNILLLSAQGIGTANADLQSLLLNNYLEALIANATPLLAIILYAEGVKLSTKESTFLPQLQILESMGATIYCCTTCVNYFQLQELMAIGQLTTMPAIVKMQTAASKIFTL